MQKLTESSILLLNQLGYNGWLKYLNTLINNCQAWSLIKRGQALQLKLTQLGLSAILKFVLFIASLNQSLEWLERFHHHKYDRRK